jgi:ribosomal protein L33
MVVYSSGWSKNQTIQANRVNGEERITFNKTAYLCPACNHHAVD